MAFRSRRYNRNRRGSSRFVRSVTRGRSFGRRRIGRRIGRRISSGL